MTRSEKRRMKKKGVVLEVLAAGGSVASACSVVSIARCTFYDWQEKDEWFDDEVMSIRRELMLANLGEMRAQAYGRYVDEVTVRETDRGVVKTKKHRFVNGKLSALRRLIEQGMESAEPTDNGQRTMDNGPLEGASAPDGASALAVDNGPLEGASAPDGASALAVDNGPLEGASAPEGESAEPTDNGQRTMDNGSLEGTFAPEGVSDAEDSEMGDVSDSEANSSSAAGVDGGLVADIGEAEVTVVASETVVSASTLRNLRRNKRQKLAKAVRKGGKR